jgi:aspartyl protease family protein
MRSLGLAVMFIASGGLPHASVAQDAAPQMVFAATELKASSNGHYIVNAEINGSTVKVLVDTGATAVALSYEDAESIGLHPGNLDFNVPISTANGLSKAASVNLDKVEIDGVRVSDVNAMVLQQGVMRGSLLGMSFLSKLSSFKVEDGVLYLKQ